MKRNLTIFLFVLISGGCQPDEEPKNKTTIDYIRQTGRLWGVTEVALNENGSITIVDAKSSGVGLNLMMRDSNNKVVDSVTLSPGQSCSLSDGRHVFITYELKVIKNSRIIIAVTDKFDARSFGDGIKRTKAVVTISSYKKEENPNKPII
ncbi:MAG: hypothetical protein OEW48_04920 [Phycisphaerae bacterium]|nr:hypothetical protein [Phycisphaerae bacterium]